MSGEVWVVVEALRSDVSEISYTMLAAGRVLATGLKSRLSALLIGHPLEKLAGTLGAADLVLGIEHPTLAEFNPEAYLRAATAAIEAHAPRVVLFGHTAIGTDLASGVAHRLHLPVVTSCRSFRFDGGEPQFSSLTCGGKITATGALPAPSCVVTVMPGGYKADEGRVSQAPPLEILPLPAGLETVRTSFNEFIEPPAGDVDIAKQEILVSVGRGIQNKDNIALVEALAKSLGGVVCGSRPVIDQGWLPITRLVGKSGKQVKPKLYLAVGISGAPEHLEGVSEADTMIAVNTDGKAPIFDVAHFGTTCNALELLPILTEKLRSP